MTVKVSVKAKRGHSSLEKLNDEVEIVHISGTPHLWLFQLILEKAKNVHTIEVQPCEVHFLGDQHRHLCAPRKIAIVTGRTNVRKVNNGSHATQRSRAEKSFLQNLEGEAKERFAFLVTHKPLKIALVTHFYGLDGQPRKTLAQLSERLNCSISSVSLQIRAVMAYLNPGLHNKKYPRHRAGYLERRLTRHQKRQEQFLLEAQTIDALWVKAGGKFPEGLPKDHYAEFSQLLDAQADGRLAQLAQEKPNAHAVLALRFGLHPHHPVRFLTLKAIGKIRGELSRQSAGELEKKAWKFLNSLKTADGPKV